MKVLLAAINSQYIHSNLAVRYLKAYTRNLDYNCEIKEFTINDRIERILEDINSSHADIVAFSCYIWNIAYAKMLSTLIKKVDENVEVLFGGPEVSYDCKKFLQENEGDYVIEGEGEETYREFIERKIQNKDVSNVKGLYSKVNNEIFYGGCRELMDINDVVFPYEKDEDLKNKIVYYEASRGCPFKCKYCLSSTTGRVRFLNVDRVKRELMFLVNKGIKLIKFVDRTFNCNHKFTMEIWKFLIDEHPDACFHFEISADVLTDDEIDLLCTAPKGLIQLEIGVQTTNDDVLKNISRYVEYKVIKEKMAKLNRVKNINKHLDLIAGLPGEDFNSFKKSFNDVYFTYPEQLQLGFLKLLKGSKMLEEASKWGIVYSPYPPYEVLKTKDLRYEEVVELKKIAELVDKYYNSHKFDTILMYFVEKFKEPFEFFMSLSNYFCDKGYFKRSISFLEYYKVFLDFNSEVLKDDNFIINELVKYDYIKFNKKNYFPKFLHRNIEKDEQKVIIGKLENAGIKLSHNYHIERFEIDVDEFIEFHKVDIGPCYILFNRDPDDKAVDVKKLLHKS